MGMGRGWTLTPGHPHAGLLATCHHACSEDPGCLSGSLRPTIDGWNSNTTGYTRTSTPSCFTAAATGWVGSMFHDRWAGRPLRGEAKDCVPKMARPDFPNCKFRCFPRWSIWSAGGEGISGEPTPPPLVFGYSEDALLLGCMPCKKADGRVVLILDWSHCNPHTARLGNCLFRALPSPRLRVTSPL